MSDFFSFNFNYSSEVQDTLVREVLSSLPLLPSSVRYYDDFLEVTHSIRDPEATDEWRLEVNGQLNYVNFSSVSLRYSKLLKLWFAYELAMLAPKSVVTYWAALKSHLQAHGEQILDSLVSLPPHEFRRRWISTYQAFSSREGIALKSILRFLCTYGVGNWTPGHLDFAATLPIRVSDPYQVVRNGDCFVPLDRQANLVNHFDDVVDQIASGRMEIETDALRTTSATLIVFQHGIRPGGIARMKIDDVIAYESGAVHIRVKLTKKKDANERRQVVRKIKREWAPILSEFYRRRLLFGVRENVHKNSLFGLSPGQISRDVTSLTEFLTGERWTPTDLRHTAAQRLADGGASHEAIAEFMGHSVIQTANVYIETSPSQSQRVNQALAISPIYYAIEEVSRTKTIDKKTLLSLPSEKQIGGVPHGIPIAGIGGCASGQSLCTKNPVLSCYTCRKFMPVRDARVHRDVVESLRPVVMQFADASRGHEESPAYTQLRRLLSQAQIIAEDIDREERNE